MKTTTFVVEVTEQDRSKWDEYVLSSKASSGYHLLGWRRIIEKVFGHETDYLIGKDELGRVNGILPLVTLSSSLFGRFLVSLPFLNYGGIIAEDEISASNLKNAAIDRARARGARHIEFRQGAPTHVLPHVSLRKVSMRLMLPTGFDELWKSFSSKLRSQVRRAEKEGMVVRFGGADCVGAFYDVFCRCMRDLGTPVYSRTFFEAILKEFPSESRICVVSLRGRPLAAGFLYGFRSMLEIPWAASDKRYNRLAPNMLLYNAILEYACEKGFREFDFGRSTSDSGTYRFKQQWGGEPHQLYWYYWVDGEGELPQLNPQNPKYQMAINVWRKLPLPIANIIGPRIVKYLP